MKWNHPIPRVLSVLACGASIAILSSCSKSPLSGRFVHNGTPQEVDMVQLVESSPGNLKGSFTISSLNKDGTRKKDTTYSVSGNVNGANISIQIDGGVSELARLFGSSTTFVGTIDGSVLKLSLGGTSSTFHKVSESEYQSILGVMDEYGRHTELVFNSMTAVTKSRTDAQHLNNELKQYIAWGEDRVANAPAVDQWYAKRIAFYSNCLKNIKPLAERKVPSWRWQECVLNIENDEYNRQQQHANIANALAQNKQQIGRLSSEIVTLRNTFPALVQNLSEACQYANSPDECKEFAKSLTTLSPNGFLDVTLSAKYSSVVPKTVDALKADADVSEKGEATLSALAKQVTAIYHSAE